ncbi:MAG: hypothetical protein ACRCWS_08000 [Propionibacteriaceae bacterium]
MTALDPTVVRTLVDAHLYEAVGELLDASATGQEFSQTRSLADFARRILDLDAEDFQELAAEHPGPWSRAVTGASFPLRPQDPLRGALGSLVPLVELMLEVLDLRARRREPQLLVVTTHLLGEYLPQLAWEARLGHGGDPSRLPHDVGERWGSDDTSCCHNSALRAAAKRTLHVGTGDIEGFTTYLDRFHSRQGAALATCAMNVAVTKPGDRPDVGTVCRNPCSWALRGSKQDRSSLDARCRLALIFAASPVIALRHHAPVGHFFGVPSMEEIAEAWQITWERLNQPWNDGLNPLHGSGMSGYPERNEALPGLAQLVSVIADRPLGPSRVIRDIGEAIAQSLGAAEISAIAGE